MGQQKDNGCGDDRKRGGDHGCGDDRNRGGRHGGCGN